MNSTCRSISIIVSIFSVRFKHDCFRGKCINPFAGLFTSWLWDVLGVQWSSCHHPVEQVMEKMEKRLHRVMGLSQLVQIWGEGLGWGGSLRRGRTVGRPHPAVALSLPSSSSLHGLPPAPSHAGGGLGDRRVTHPTLPRVEGGSWGPASPAPSPAGSRAGVRSHHPKYS